MSEQDGRVEKLEVVSVDFKRGCLLNVAPQEQVLLPLSELPYDEALWPQVGDRVYVALMTDRNGRLSAIAAGEEQLDPLTFHAPEGWKNRWLDSTVYNLIDIGAFVICEEEILGFGAIGFIHESELTRPLRIGERVNVRITFVREDGRVNCSMRKLKEDSRNEDAERILQYLKTCKDFAMPYSDETPADLVRKKFGISKAAFKRALGKLMKDDLVEQSGNWTQLKQSDET